MTTSWEKQDKQPAATNYDLLRSEHLSSRRQTHIDTTRQIFNFNEEPRRWQIIEPPTHLGSLSTGISDGKASVTLSTSFLPGNFGDTGIVDVRYTFSEPLDLTQYLQSSVVSLSYEYQFGYVGAGASSGFYYPGGVFFRVESSASDYWSIHPEEDQEWKLDPDDAFLSEATWYKFTYILPLDDTQIAAFSGTTTTGSPDITSVASIRIKLEVPYTVARQDGEIGFFERFSDLRVSTPDEKTSGRSTVMLAGGARYGFSEESRVITVGDNGHFQSIRDAYLHIKYSDLNPSFEYPVQIRLMPGWHKWPDVELPRESDNTQPANALGDNGWDINWCQFIGEDGAVVQFGPGTESLSWFDIDAVDLIHFENLMFVPDTSMDWANAAKAFLLPLFKFEQDYATDLRVVLESCKFVLGQVNGRLPSHGGSNVYIRVNDCLFYWDDNDPAYSSIVSDYMGAISAAAGTTQSGLALSGQSSGMTSQTTEELYDIHWEFTNNRFISLNRGNYDMKHMLFQIQFDMPATVNNTTGQYGAANRSDFTDNSTILIDNNFFLVDNGTPDVGNLGLRDAHCIRLFGVAPPGGMTISNNTTIGIDYSSSQPDVTPCYFHSSSGYLLDTQDQRVATVKDHTSYIILPNYTGDGLDGSGSSEFRAHHWRTNEIGLKCYVYNSSFWTWHPGTVPLQGWRESAFWQHYPGNGPYSTGLSYQDSTLVIGDGIYGNVRTVAIIDSADWGSFAVVESLGEPLLRDISGASGSYSHTNWVYKEADGYSTEVEIDDTLSWTLGDIVGKITFTTSDGTYYIPVYDGITGS